MRTSAVINVGSEVPIGRLGPSLQCGGFELG
jgi:hypothetical protein